MYDVAIIGAGPAGAALARMTGKARRVLIVDKRPPVSSSNSAKCCGGLLAPDAQLMLAGLGLGVPRDVLLGPQLFVVRAIDLQRNVERFYQRHYINMDRERFDRWLISLIPSSVDVRLGCLFGSFESVSGGFKIELSQDGKTYFERARIVVGADGATSRVRRTAFPEHPHPRVYVALQEWFEADELLPYFSVIFDRDITDFYSWVIPKDNFLVVGSALFPPERASARFQMLTGKLRDYGFRFGRSADRKSASLLRPVKTRQVCAGEGGIALVGEAAGLVSPSSGEGLSYALRSAAILAEALEVDTVDPLKRYRRRTIRVRANIFSKNLKRHFIYNAWLRAAVMRAGFKTTKVASQ